ncbi:MAG: hypothetical protein ACREBH_02310 [Candidatus Micrarchaeaceae archaeon]
MLQQGLLEYLFTVGIIISFVALVIGIFKDRKGIWKVLEERGLLGKDLAVVFAIVALFLFIELYFIKPTQLLFFDDAIYQAMALTLLHTGQAWMCNYGNATACFSGQVYHEPIGLSFNMAIAFLFFGANRATGYGAELFLAALSVFMSFFASLLLLGNRKTAFFTELLMALSPVVLVWAMPTNSDVAVLAYSLISIFFFLVFLRRRSLWSFSNMLFSFSLLFYMKVDEIFFIPVFIAFYLLLESKGVIKSLSDAFKAIKDNFLNTKLLVVVLFFLIAVVPSIMYSYNESMTDGYGWQGTIIQNTCLKGMPPMNVSGEINLMNFKANICANAAFWLDQYKSDYVMQPIAFTALAVMGIGMMLAMDGYRKKLAAIAIWFGVFFLLYTAFYAGSVIYGVDWRFMLSLIAPVCMLGGFAVAEILDLVGTYANRLGGMSGALNAIAVAAAVVLLFAPIGLLMPMLSINPSLIQQAGDARFYEGFVYNESRLIPSGCIVYTYDPTLFQLNNRTATQIDNLYNSSQVGKYMQQYKCLVLDYGYWCHTPNNECTYANQSFNLVPIATVTYNTLGYNYGFYYIENK